MPSTSVASGSTRPRKPMTEEKIKDMHKQIMGLVGNRKMMSLIRDGRTLQQQDPTIIPIMLDNFQNWLDNQSRQSADIPLLWRSVIYILYSMIYNFDTWPASMIILNCQVDWTQPIGTGGTANIFNARWEDEAVVVKRFNVKLTPEQKKLFVREVVTWKQLRSPYILKLYGLYEPEVRPSMRYLLVSPRMPHTLTSFVCPDGNILSATTPGGYCPAEDRLRLIKELAEAIAYLHARKIVHGDIKDANILISEDKGIRLTDFGLSLVGDITQGSFSTTGSGRISDGWASPELFGGVPGGRPRRRMPHDVFGFACVCYMLITGNAPHAGMDIGTYLAFISEDRQPRPSAEQSVGGLEMSRDLWDTVVHKCWKHKPHMRLTMKQVLTCLEIDVDSIYRYESPPCFTLRAGTKYSSVAPDDLSFKPGDKIEVVSCSTTRWHVRDIEGNFGYVKLSSEDVKKCTLVRMRALASYKSNEKRELSFNKNEWLNIVALGPERWWMARNDMNEAGFVPVDYLRTPALEDWARDKNKYGAVEALVKYEPDKTRSINHLSFVKGQRLKILRRPESGDYFIAEVTVRGKVYVGIVPAHMIEPIDDQATTSHQPRRIDDQSE